ncbi:hypothetical protein C0J52_11774 [Blattella germanica]|nr:hypothetical protein C0J52_11774 [Blattella germanica]
MFQKRWSVIHTWKAQVKRSLIAPINIGPQINRCRDRTHFLLRFIGVREHMVCLSFKVDVQNVVHASESKFNSSLKSSLADLENSVNAGRLLQSTSIISQES